MKNLGLPKLLAIFAVFIAVIGVAAFLIVRSTQKPTVVVKRHFDRADRGPAVSAPDVPLDAVTVSATAASATVVSAGPSVAASTPGATSAPADVWTGPETPGNPRPFGSSQSVNSPAATQDARDAFMLGKFAEYDTKLADIERRLSKDAPSHAEVRHAVTSAHVAARPSRPARNAEKSEEFMESTTPLKGYASTAVVGHRAWVSTPDGREDSVSRGEAVPVPGPIVRSVSPLGVVITTTGQRIDPH